MWDLPCAQQASFLEGGSLLWILPLYLHGNKKSDDDDDDEYIKSSHFSSIHTALFYHKNGTLKVIDIIVPKMHQFGLIRQLRTQKMQMEWQIG